MRILYYEWGYPYDHEIQNVFQQFDIEIIQINDAQLDRIDEFIEKEKPDYCFSIDFYADFSNYCETIGLKYVTWVLVLPNLELYTDAIKNSCNMIFICDSFLASEFQKKGIPNVFFLPDAVSVREYREQTNEIPASYIGIKYDRRIDSFYEENSNLSLYSKGYLEGVIQCQRVLRGASVLPQSIPKSIIEEFEEKETFPKMLMKEFKRHYLADLILSNDVTFHEQQILVYQFRNQIYVYADYPLIENQKKYFPLPVTQEDTDLIYQKSIMNIVIPEKSYNDAIPRQTLEIMGCGGFVFSSKQKDYTLFFNNDEDLVFYENDLERVEKMLEYQTNPEKRKRICESGYLKVKSAHTYMHRVNYMMNVICN